MKDLDLTKTCFICGEDQTVRVDKLDYGKWVGGELIQNAMPYLTSGERELLISGYCNSCFDNLFKDDD